jgi:hypothetical protein
VLSSESSKSHYKDWKDAENPAPAHYGKFSAKSINHRCQLHCCFVVQPDSIALKIIAQQNIIESYEYFFKNNLTMSTLLPTMYEIANNEIAYDFNITKYLLLFRLIDVHFTNVELL